MSEIVYVRVKLYALSNDDFKLTWCCRRRPGSAGAGARLGSAGTGAGASTGAGAGAGACCQKCCTYCA